MCAKTCLCNSCYKQHTCVDCFYMKEITTIDCFSEGITECKHYSKRRWIKNEDIMEKKIKK